MEVSNKPVAMKVRRAIEKLKNEGKTLGNITGPVVFPTPSEEIERAIIGKAKIHVVREMLMDQVFHTEYGPFVLELFRQHKPEAFEIVASHRKKGHAYEEYVFTSQGPRHRIYTLEGRSIRPKKGQVPEKDELVSLEELLCHADSVLTFQAEFFMFIGEMAATILGERRSSRF